MQEAQERTLDAQKKELMIDPRRIKRQHRWKLGHDPADQDDYDDPNVVYLNVEQHEEDNDPDQRHLLSGGPESGLACERCGTMTHVVGEMSRWDIYNQPKVSLVNRDSLTEKRIEELKQEMICILKCSNCSKTYQWDCSLLPRPKV